MAMKRYPHDVEGHAVYLERRSYGRGAFYCWAYVDVAGERECCGDPWPSVTPPRAEIERAVRFTLDEVAARS